MKRIKHLIFVGILCLTTALSMAFLIKAPMKKAEAIAVGSIASLSSGTRLDMNIDTFSLSDLTIGSETGLMTLPNTSAYRKSNATVTFSEANVNKNIVFRFKYNVTNQDSSISSQVNFDANGGTELGSDKNNKNSLRLQGHNTFFMRQSGNDQAYKDLGMLDLGLHEIEFGRIAILNSEGNPNGTYYCYLKVDKIMIRSDKNSYDASLLSNKLLLYYNEANTTGDNLNTFYDISYNAETYETADEISVKNMTFDGNPTGAYIHLDGAKKNFGYNATAANKSVVLRFQYRVADTTANWDHQFHFYDGYAESSGFPGGMIWFKSNDTIIRTDDSTYNKFGVSTLNTADIHNVEIGRLYVTSGANQGKYLVYAKVDGTTFIEYYSASMGDKANFYITGNYGDYMYDVDYDFTATSSSTETPKVISVSDLKQGGNLIGDVLDITANTDLTFDNSDKKEYGSLVFKFKYKVLDATQNQFHLSCTGNYTDDKDSGEYKWASASSIILNNGGSVHLGKSYLRKVNYGWNNDTYAMTVGETYTVEFGRLAKMDHGAFTGTYRIYLKINGVMVKEEDRAIPEAVTNGNLVFITHGGSNTIYDIDYAPDTYEEADEISIADLSYNNKAVGNIATLNAEKVYSYNATAEHKSLVFKFKYVVLNQSTISCQVHFADGYSESSKRQHPAGMVWFRNDKTYMRINNYGEDAAYINCGPAFASAGTYVVELGKLYVTSGANANKYYIYLKVDGNLLLERYVDSMQDVANIFTTGTNGDLLYDIDFVPDTYEEADQISISNLQFGGQPVGNTATLDAQKVYSYEATAEHKSVVYKFKYATDDLNNVSCQFHFADGWSEGKGFPIGMVWLTKDNVYLRNETYVENDETKYRYLETHAAPFANAGIYNVELGKLYVASGTNAGKYYVYVKVQGALLLDWYADSMQDKANLFLTGTGGGFLYDINYTPCGATHQVELEHHEAVAVSCTTDGAPEYWYCSNCEKYFSNAEGTTEIEDIVIEATGHNLTHHEAVAVSCTTDGANEYWSCDICNKNFSDEACQNEIANLDEYLVIEALGHDYQWVIDKEATYTEDGLRHQECSRCHDKQQEGTVIPMITCVHQLSLVEGTAPTCSNAGTKPYYTCSECHRNYEDEDAQVEIENLEEYLPIAKLPHTEVIDVAVAPTCTEAGKTQGKHCSVCNEVLLAQEVVEALGHDMIEDAAVAATCTTAGKEAGSHCSRCDHKEGGAVIPALGHNLTHHDQVAPKPGQDGNAEYWSCDRCNKKFSDANAQHELATEVLTVDAIVDIKSVSDLSFGGKTGQQLIASNTNTDTTFEYSSTNVNKNLVFKFKYHVLDTNTSDKNAVNIYFVIGSDKWNAKNNLWLRGEGNHFRSWDGSKLVYQKNSALPEGMHEIEFGRIAILNGESLTGYYYVYWKLNGVLAAESYTPYEASELTNKIFLNFSEQNLNNKMLDINFTPDTYEDADVISISDLMFGGKPFGGVLSLGEEPVKKAYSYNATAEHKSVMFRFVYHVTDPNDVACQFHFSNQYLEHDEGNENNYGVVWIQDNNTYIKASNLADNNYVKGPKAFAEAGDYTVEVGKLYVSAGSNAGKYLLYLKVEETILVQAYIDTMPDKANVFFTRKTGGNLYDVNYAECGEQHAGTPVHVEAKAPTCSEPGNIEYWWCKMCGKIFSDEAMTTEVQDVVVKAQHTLNHHEAAAGEDCAHHGTIEFWQCSVCNKMFSDASGETEITSNEGALGAHKLTHHEAVAATCTEAGVKEYWSCSVCEKNFADEAGAQVLSDLAVAPHHTIVKVDSVAATCTEAGSIEHYECSACHKMFSDAQGANEITDIAVAPHHTIVAVDALAPTCTSDGHIAHFECSVCHKMFSDAEGKNELESASIPAAHTLVHRDAVAATCTEEGNVEYYHCSECGKNFSDAEGKNLLTNVATAAHHELVHHEGKAATCEEAGNIEYWECSVCGKKFSDAQGRVEVADVRIPAKGHSYNQDGICDNCGAQDPDFKKPNFFGCKSSVSATAVFVLLGLACVVYKKKKEELL